jgi:hypothetical protein
MTRPAAPAPAATTVCQYVGMGSCIYTEVLHTHWELVDANQASSIYFSRLNH